MTMRSTSSAAVDSIPEQLHDFARRRAAELTGVALLILVAALSVALATWSVQDPSLNHASAGNIRNLLGAPGAVAADLVMQLVGLAAIALLTAPAFWGLRLLTHRNASRPGQRLVAWMLGTSAAAALCSLLPVTDRWPLPTGLGGVLGDALMAFPSRFMGGSTTVTLLEAVALASIMILCLTFSTRLGVSPYKIENAAESTAPFVSARPAAADVYADEDDCSGDPGVTLISLGAAIHAILALKGALRRLWSLGLSRRAQEGKTARAPWLSGDSDGWSLESAVGSELRPNAPAASPEARRGAGLPKEFGAYGAAPSDSATLQRRLTSDTDGLWEPKENLPMASTRVSNAAPALKPGKRVSREAQPSFLDKRAYQLPPMLMLAEAKRQIVSKISEDALEQNARLLEGVLDDFGVKGEIINVRPGPVVTLYELEPAPGIKSSRVIGLADDIARSMSAISARVAVVQGRNAIGIELPNQRRETVYLRELLGSEDFEKSKHRLAIALGKTIGGEPVIVDLARMPHLLVAGTTGSGKSVAINTMILSLLYRLKPEECRLIMVDPKMLELSVYDGIPHLLTPVVTDPKKAVTALKWAVREMEDRYKKMSKVGVRNIDGFNARVLEASAKGEVIKRTVQTGFDRETGEAVYEQETMEIVTLPYIVVIVDEMADLMMVAGKDIEGAIQRLAQMARAAGIHLIMATQRPSVDVITGTIKANFPTRISFQVTSKIDSRTILGEQGAEQLLGQGDMLYMAGGGRISRVHGPFVSDGEVEKIVAHLKTQGHPQYLEAITAEDADPDADDTVETSMPGGMDAEESGDLYDRAVNIVLRDRKCSTSYIQRRLSVGYNKAASLVERMEKESVVGAPNHSGKREILVGGGVDRDAFDPE